MADLLREQQPPVRVSSLVLRQWYAKYHPDSGPVRYDSVAELEDGMGDALRRDYAGVGYRALRTALGERRKVVLVSKNVLQVWVAQYGASVPESADASGAASSSSIVTKLIGAKAVEEALLVSVEVCRFLLSMLVVSLFSCIYWHGNNAKP